MKNFPFSDKCPGADSQGQERHLRPLRDSAGRQGQEEDQNRASGTQSGVEGELQFVSTDF